MNGIKAIRTQLGLSQQAFGEALGMTQGNVSLYEVADQTVLPDVAKRVIELARSKGFACSFDEVYAPQPTLRLLIDVAAPAAQEA